LIFKTVDCHTSVRKRTVRQIRVADEVVGLGVAYPEEDANHCDENKKISKHPPSSIKLYDETWVSHSSTHRHQWFYNLLPFSVLKLLSTEICQARP
jgi:hypothetical protein